MDRASYLQDLQQRIAELFQSSPAADLERNVKALMAQTFQRMDLITREEFEVQLELVQRLRRRVEALEAQLAARSTTVPPRGWSPSEQALTSSSSHVPGRGP